jgi:hypothetical protein
MTGVMISRGRLARRTASFARIFQVIAAAAAAGASSAAVSCSTSSGGSNANGADAGDASTAFDGSDIAEVGPHDAGALGDADAAVDAGSDVVCGALIALDDASTDANDICDYTLTCGLTKNYGLTHVGCTILPVGADGGPDDDAAGFPSCYVLEGRGCTNGAYVAPDGAELTFQCIGCFGGAGRRPAGLVARRRSTRGERSRAHPAGAYFAEMARLEAASVLAFDRLARELEAHGAPRRLVDAARESARDEERHAASAERIARRFGACATEARVRPVRRRSLAEIARENAVEGCVRETFGALVNTWQAAHAQSDATRRALAEIARDETKHAALSWEIAAWAERRLTVAERKNVKRARRRAISKLARDIAFETPAAVREHAGVPDARARAAMLADLTRSLF